MTEKEKENRIHSFALSFLERQQIAPNLYADQIIRGYKEGYHQAEKDLKMKKENKIMSQRDKELLLTDLTARLPYDVLVLNKDGDIESFTWQELKEFGDGYISKPYLRPMSSMTEEEKKELEDKIDKDFKLAIIACKENDITKSTSGFYKIDWLNKKMFDYRGLIERGLALEAPEGMYLY